MEPYYYQQMNKQRQAVYHAILQGITALADEFQIPALDGETLYNVFFQLRLDHPEIFWATGFKYRYYQESPNIQFLPEYLFDRAKVKEHQKAMKSRVEKLARPAQKLSESEKEKYIHDFVCENVKYDLRERKILMLECDYEVKQIDGDYAHLQRIDRPEEELKLVARALLPMEIYEGCILHYEMMQYSMK